MTDHARSISMKMFNKGKQVSYDGRTYFVEYVHVKGNTLLVKLKGVDIIVDSSMIDCEYTILDIPNINVKRTQ